MNKKTSSSSSTGQKSSTRSTSPFNVSAAPKLSPKIGSGQAGKPVFAKRSVTSNTMHKNTKNSY